ncbi:hypothetical protein E6W36_12680 [Hankyongella ginsenosidimutans]|jgi:HPt (histidine-containing phosphotransfer) domain-containing protein|uniref:HPt domain-containing protein n=1 Tax=Hankyongella ginsenosidimutans TaxID=1763828 RepID=A0A4D7C2W9_9SPHN|nr:Hpt domain-containing protein [Hankyongella ginsenosidimutans]QCI80054.1 hypothetical protein E6W36_12680 [Hankyongella ginsenosidimutans]TXG83139.1 MAG: hypothetical protein E6R12_09190 [Sphingomonadales bacterium]
MHADDLEEARLAVADRLSDLEAGLAQLSTNDLKQQVHSLKGLAAAYGLIVIESLCHGLEQRLASGRDDAAVLAYIDRMNDAAEDDRMDDASVIPALEAEIARHLHEV